MGSSAGRRDAEYVRHRTLYQQTRPPCTIHSGPWCTGVGLTVDHVPAMHTVGGHRAWLALYDRGQAHYAPACLPCQTRQGAALRNGTTPTWTW